MTPWVPGRTPRSVESDFGACTLARSSIVTNAGDCGNRVRQKRSRPTDCVSDNIDMLKAYGRGMYSASAQATRKGRSSLPGCFDLRGGEGVRTVGRLHPGQAGERLLKQRPKTQCENVGSCMAPAIRGCSSRLLCHAWNSGRAHRPTDIVQPVCQFSFVGVLVSCGLCAVLLRFPTVGHSRHTDSVARRAPP